MYLVSLWCVSFNDRQCIVKSQSSAFSFTYTHHVTQDQSCGLICILSCSSDVVRAKLRSTKEKRIKLTTTFHCNEPLNLPKMILLDHTLLQVLVTFTFLVKLVEDEEPTMALLMTRPEKTDWTELMKLDFPAPTGPISRTLASVTVSLAGLNDLTDSISVSLTLNTQFKSKLKATDTWMFENPVS